MAVERVEQDLSTKVCTLESDAEDWEYFGNCFSGVRRNYVRAAAPLGRQFCTESLNIEKINLS